MSVGAQASSQPRAGRLILTLGLAGLLSGLILVGVYEATLPRITANQARALTQAVFTVVPGSTRIQPLRLENGALIPIQEIDPNDPGVVFGAYDDTGKLLGYAIPGEGPGFQDMIKLIYGYDPTTRRVVGMQVLISRETPGLGDKIYKDHAFVDNFSALAVEPEIVVTKKGRTKPNEVDAITGATISSNAVVKILNAGNQKWLAVLPRAEDAPPLREGGS